ncbi:glycosyltransferase [Nocardia sp. XZ_19_385]|uniref:glycosyltransferase n=1 Tax=Nocardia sp. XZ_19_385 TaxID=2769488 RepID=UPI001E304D23|nr:glycosyltransferase [Nocardia sp. XZ_19_385]
MDIGREPRVLVTTNPFESHFRGLVTLVDTVRAYGHDVRVAAPAEWSPWLRSTYGVETIDAGALWVDLEFDDRLFGSLIEQGADAFDRQLLSAFVSDRVALRTAEGVIELSDTWRPDVVVHECTEFGGYLAAEALGIPNITVDIGPLPIVRKLHQDLIRPALTAQREKLGLPEEPSVPGILRHLAVSLAPREFDHADFETPLVRYRHQLPVRRGEQLPEIFARFPQDRPIVYVSLGSIGPYSPRFMDRMTDLYEEIFIALAEINCTAVVSLPSLYRNAFRSLAPHIHLFPYISQSLLLPNADLFITHGGLNSIRDTLTCGVPQLLMPFFADHPGNAARCESLGTGIRVDPMSVQAAEIHASCEKILQDDDYRAVAKSLKRHMWALPPQSAFVDDLLHLIPANARGE